jgi:hypothetical protein
MAEGRAAALYALVAIMVYVVGEAATEDLRTGDVGEAGAR